jgi:serine/threonine-protein kinase
MGVVYKAWHGPTGRLVALKMILPEAAMADKANRLFQREISVMRRLRHPAIVRLIDHGMFEGEHFLVCEYVPDGSAETLLKEGLKGPLPVPMACGIICQVLEGIGYAHDRGYIHRDIKPKNILLKHTGNASFEAKLSDFGLAKSYTNAGQSGITRVGESSGTIFFMAPEQITDYRFVKPPADLYSIGVGLYYLLTGRYQFDFPSPMEQVRGLLRGKQQKDPLLMVLEDKPIPIRDRLPGLPKHLANVVDKAIRKTEGKRFQSAQEFLEEIARAAQQAAP